MVIPCYISRVWIKQKRPNCGGAAISVAAPDNPANLGVDETNSVLKEDPSSVDFPSLDYSRFGEILFNVIMK